MKKTAVIPFAVIFRSCAVFIILFQIRLIAGSLADTPVFITTLLFGFASAVFLSFLYNKKRGLSGMNHLAAAVSIGMIPWITRALIAAPRFFIPQSTGSAAITMDSLLLNLDRNNFVSLFPYYWSALTTWFCLRSSGRRKFLRACVIADAAILLFIYSAAKTANVEIYRWPVIIIAVFTAAVFFKALALVFSMPPETKLRKTEIIISAAALAAIIGAGGYLFLKPIREQAVKMGGGFLEPGFFSFGFSKFPKLDSEISMKNDLLFIVKKEKDENILLRQLVISGYSRKEGFYPLEEFDVKNHPPRLPPRQEFYPRPEPENARRSLQEYFLVNLNPSSFIGMKEPVSVTPYESWDSSSFNSAYAVESLVSGADYIDLYRSYRAASGVENKLSHEMFGMSETEYNIYTDYGNDTRILSLAEEITDGIYNYADKIFAVYEYLKYGDYRYSLKPGIASDGDQLGQFLFKTKKGYCTYYAFAYTLLLRSLGIPARVAAGFYADKETGVFDYYPVRADMAHAWTEAAFPQYGWIEIDPTSEELAAGEEPRFFAGMDPALFERLMKEILDNRSKMKIKEDLEEDKTRSASALGLLTRSVISIIKNYRQYILISAVIILFLYIRCGVLVSAFLTKNPRKRSVRIFKHACRRLRLAGFSRANGNSAENLRYTEPEWAFYMNGKFGGIYPMYQQAAAARFAPEYTDATAEEQWKNYGDFRASYSRQVSLPRRIAAWVLPPLAAIGGKGNAAAIIVLFLCLLSPDTRAQDSSRRSGAADELYGRALNADYSELWDRAIELYKEGMTLFPEDPRFPWSLGDLYYMKSLYSLAWNEYRKTDSLDPANPDILIMLARTAGFLNRDNVSAEYYERVLELEPDNIPAISGLGWMYFKVHRLEDGKKLLLSALERFPENAELAMTLGSVYSDMYNYEESKNWYTKAISLGEKTRDKSFASIAYYNLSILESGFYRYDLCMEAIDSSLKIHNHFSGRLAKGELYKRRLELEKSRSEYEAAYETDTSPLSKLYLAHIYQISGKLEAARLYAENCLKDGNHSWMYYYGIDTDRYRRDIHEVLAAIYSGLANVERLTPRAKPHEKALSLLKYFSWKLKYGVNIRLYQKHCLAAANAYSPGKNGGFHPDSFRNYSSAFESYPRRSLNYLNVSREFETALIPAAAPSYDLDEGVLTGGRDLLLKALRGLDPLWERELISKCRAELSDSEELFALNRGALRQAGIRLPVQIVISGKTGGTDRDTARVKKHLRKALLKAGFRNSAAGEDARYILNIEIKGNSVNCDLADLKAGAEQKMETLNYTFPLRETTRAECYSLAGNISGAAFTVE